MKKTHVAIMLFENVEVLDFAGPFEVFSRARTEPGLQSRWSDDSAPFHVFTVAKTTEPVNAIGNLKVLPDHDFANAPKIDILVVPGGLGSRALLNDEQTLDWIRQVDKRTELTTSVCTGSLVLAKAGLLEGRNATTHWGAYDALADLDQSIKVDKKKRFVDDGIMTSAGVSAGIDLSLHIVEQRCGADVANDTAKYMDYPRH